MNSFREAATDVLVVGAGPCGITMANLLGTYGVRAVAIDAQPGIYEYPRAVGIDDESLRTFQAAGIAHRLLEDIVQNTPIRYYTSWGRLMAHVEPSVRPFGWPRRNNFLQPLFEAALRERVTASDTVDLWLGATLTGYEQDADGVTAVIQTSDGRGHPAARQVPRRDRRRAQHRAQDRRHRDDRRDRPEQVAGRGRRRRRARRALLGGVLRPEAAGPDGAAAIRAPALRVQAPRRRRRGRAHRPAAGAHRADRAALREHPAAARAAQRRVPAPLPDRRAVPGRPRVPRRGCRPPPAAVLRPGHELRHPRRHQSCLEAGARAGRVGERRACSTPTTASGASTPRRWSTSPPAWGRCTARTTSPPSMSATPPSAASRRSPGRGTTSCR